jgi:hypothetical protein
MPWTVIGNIVVALLPRLITLVEKKSTPVKDGGTKKETVKEIVMATVEATEGATGRDIFNDPEVSAAYDLMNDAIVSFQDLLADKKQLKPAPAK